MGGFGGRSRLHFGVVRDVLALYGRPNVITTGYIMKGTKINEELSLFYQSIVTY